MAGLCELIATVPTGLEGGAADEVQETLGRKAEATRGRINFNVASLEQLKLVIKHVKHEWQGMIDDLYLVIDFLGG